MFYFAYGSNLNKAQMAMRCPKAKALGKVILPKARLIFCGVADVEYDDDMSVQGGLWKITKECEEELDHYEGVRKGGGLYLKQYITVSLKLHGRKRVGDALIYVMNPDHRRAFYCMPSSFYLGSIRKGYRDFDLDKQALDRAVAMTREECGPPDQEEVA